MSRWETGDRTPRGALLVAYVDLLRRLRDLHNDDGTAANGPVEKESVRALNTEQ